MSLAALFAVLVALVLVLVLVLGRSPALAETPLDQDVDVSVNYVYATQFGFGGYSIGGLDVSVFSLPLEFTFDDVIGPCDVRLGLPVIYGYYRFEGTLDDGTLVKASTNSLATEIRAKLDIPVFEHFRVTPLAAWGFGGTFDFSASASGGSGDRADLDAADGPFYTYQIGLSSLYQVPWNEFTLSFGLAYLYAGDSPFGDTDEGFGSEAYGTFRTGFDVRHPLGFKIGPHITPDLSGFFIYSLFSPSLQFTRFEEEALQVPQIFELGATLGSSTPMELPVIGGLFDGMRIGLAYDFGEDFDAVNVVFGFPF
ncbi:MAG: hypothetical protein FJ144_25710 [Deltaproteobacteria bacterium]|nr:hypothetical protein [Deltaproteobacteria bacterium]